MFVTRSQVLGYTSTGAARIYLCAAFTIGAFGVASARDPTISETLIGLSRDLNRSLPIQIDREKILQTTVVFRETLVFKYTFIDETTISNPRFSKERYSAFLLESLGQSTCADPASYALLKRGATYNYLFVTRSGMQAIDFSLTADICTAYLGRAKSKR